MIELGVQQQAERRQFVSHLGLVGKAQPGLRFLLRPPRRLDRLADRLLDDLFRLLHGNGRPQRLRVVARVAVTGVVATPRPVGHRIHLVDRRRRRVALGVVDIPVRPVDGLLSGVRAEGGRRCDGTCGGTKRAACDQRGARRGRLRHGRGHRRFGRQGRGARRGRQDQRLGATAATLGQGQFRGDPGLGGGAQTGADHVGDLGADPVIAGRVVEPVVLLRFDQVEIRRRILALEQLRHPRQEARALRDRLGRDDLRAARRPRQTPPDHVRRHRLLRSGPGGGLGILASAARALVGVSRLHRLRRLQAGPGAPAHQRQKARIGHDQPGQQEPRDRAQLGHGEPEDEGSHRDDGHAQHQHQQLEPEAGSHRQDVEQRAHHHVAEQPAKPEAVRPLRPDRLPGGIDGSHGHPDRREYQAGQRAFLAAVQDHAQAPDDQRQRHRPAAPADDHEQRRGDGGADAAHRVLHRRIRGREETGIVGRVGRDHRSRHDSQDHQHEAQKFLAAFFDRGLHVAVEKGIATPRLICHLLPRSSCRFFCSCRGSSRHKDTLAAARARPSSRRSRPPWRRGHGPRPGCPRSCRATGTPPAAPARRSRATA